MRSMILPALSEILILKRNAPVSFSESPVKEKPDSMGKKFTGYLQRRFDFF